MDNRINTLLQRHYEIDDAVRRETARPAPNSMTVRALKKMRLKLKDQITMLTRSGVPHAGDASRQPNG
jgi:hypothetical protein